MHIYFAEKPMRSMGGVQGRLPQLAGCVTLPYNLPSLCVEHPPSPVQTPPGLVPLAKRTGPAQLSGL